MANLVECSPNRDGERHHRDAVGGDAHPEADGIRAATNAPVDLPLICCGQGSGASIRLTQPFFSEGALCSLVMPQDKALSRALHPLLRALCTDDITLLAAIAGEHSGTLGAPAPSATPAASARFA